MLFRGLRRAARGQPIRFTVHLRRNFFEVKSEEGDLFQGRWCGESLAEYFVSVLRNKGERPEENESDRTFSLADAARKTEELLVGVFCPLGSDVGIVFSYASEDMTTKLWVRARVPPEGPALRESKQVVALPGEGGGPSLDIERALRDIGTQIS